MTLILSPLYVCCDLTISFLSVLGKFPPHCLIETRVFEILMKGTAMKSLDLQLKVMALVMVYTEICVRRNVPIWSLVAHAVIVIQKVENETYAAHLIFKQ